MLNAFQLKQPYLRILRDASLSKFYASNASTNVFKLDYSFVHQIKFFVLHLSFTLSPVVLLTTLLLYIWTIVECANLSCSVFQLMNIVVIGSTVSNRC